MDPNEALRQIRAAVTHLRTEPNTIGSTPTYDAVHQLLDHVEALDEWLCRGGFAPKAWQLLDVQWRDVVGGPPDPLGPPNPVHGELP